MRPPQIAGEKMMQRIRDLKGKVASMRPPQIAGEKPRRGRAWQGYVRRFNEAPADRGGKATVAPQNTPRTRRFNEAPADRGGKEQRGRKYQEI